MTFAIVYYESAKATNGKIVGRDIPSLTEARKIAYRAVKNGRVGIFDSSTAKYVDFLPTGQRLQSTMGEEVAMVIRHNDGAFGDIAVFYYPNYYSQYYKKRNVKYPKYLLNSNGTLGQGKW